MIYRSSVVGIQNNLQPTLTISIVTFNPNFDELKKTLSSLKIALDALQNKSFLITIVDNSINNEVEAFIQFNYPELRIRLISGHGNIGFGRAHNMTILEVGEFHLILNPDIHLNPDALINAWTFMQAHENCGMLSPHATWPNGQRQYLCKRYPSVFDLLLRGFAPEKIRTIFRDRLARYEMQNETQSTVYWNPPIASGCFMFFRGAIFKNSGGFNERFFLYFEDFDLSLRLRKATDTAYVPTVSVVHTGGHAAKKGFWHVKVFIKSAVTFFRIHGFKIF